MSPLAQPLRTCAVSCWARRSASLVSEAAIGLAGAAGTTRLVRGMLFDLDPLDPSTILGAALLLIAVSALASYLPARRATRLDAVAMLRNE